MEEGLETVIIDGLSKLIDDMKDAHLNFKKEADKNAVLYKHVVDLNLNASKEDCNTQQQIIDMNNVLSDRMDLFLADAIQAKNGAISIAASSLNTNVTLSIVEGIEAKIRDFKSNISIPTATLKDFEKWCEAIEEICAEDTCCASDGHDSASCRCCDKVPYSFETYDVCLVCGGTTTDHENC